MRIVKSFNKYIESISGTEIVTKHIGPNYPQYDNSPLVKTGLVDVLYSNYHNKIVTYDQYQSYYIEYLKSGGVPLYGFNQINLDTIFNHLNNKPE